MKNTTMISIYSNKHHPKANRNKQLERKQNQLEIEKAQTKERT